MTAAFLETVNQPELLEGLPLWIVENQQIGWSGAWEETPTAETRSWADSLMEERAPPYEALADDGITKLGPRSTFSPADLRVLVYPKLPQGQEGPYLYGPKVDSTTDCDGWIYATKPSRLNSQRLGGRATPRFGDRVRRRRWYRGEPTLAESAAAVFWCDNSSSAMQSLWKAVGDLTGSRSISQMPIDPTAVIRRSHSDVERYQKLCRRLSAWDDLPVLMDMLVAAVYSRAAYAYTGRRGLFDSLTQGAMVFSVHRAAFDYAEHVDDASNEAAFLDMMCLNPEDLICAQWRSLGPLQPAFAVARDHDLKWIVVAVRGTLSLKDILTDCAVHPVPFLEGTAHEGFVATSVKLLSEIEELLLKETTKHKDYRLVFCGHSMGGAVSAMCVALLRDKAAKEPERYGQWAAQCCALGIGTPAVLSRNICERLAQTGAAFMAVNAQDWSPRSSVSSASELLDDLVELSLARTMMRMATGAGLPPQRPEPPNREQLPPGVILQIVPGQEKPLLKASAADYRHSMPAWPDVAAHIPLAYVEGLASGLARAMRGDVTMRWRSFPALGALRRLLRGRKAPAASAKLPSFPDKAREVLINELRLLCSESLLVL